MNRVRGERISYVPQGSGNGMNPLLPVGYQVGEPLMIHQNLSKKEALAGLSQPCAALTSGRRKSWPANTPTPSAAGCASGR